MNGPGICAHAICAIVCALACASVVANDSSEPASAGLTDNADHRDMRGRSPRWKVEIARRNTDRATAGETSGTRLRLEAYPEDGLLAMLRLDLPFPDDRTDFEGALFNPHLGDIRTRAKTKPVNSAGPPLSPFLELAYPTADPKRLGQGKYQVIFGVETSLPLGGFRIHSVRHAISFDPLVEQTVSVAGDERFEDINYSKLELALGDSWSNYSLTLTLKGFVDWENAGATGAVAELEGGISFGRGWLASLMLGHRAWGSDVPGTYGTRIEITVEREF